MKEKLSITDRRIRCERRYSLKTNGGETDAILEWGVVLVPYLLLSLMDQRRHLSLRPHHPDLPLPMSACAELRHPHKGFEGLLLPCVPTQGARSQARGGSCSHARQSGSTLRRPHFYWGPLDSMRHEERERQLLRNRRTSPPCSVDQRRYYCYR